MGTDTSSNASGSRSRPTQLERRSFRSVGLDGPGSPQRSHVIPTAAVDAHPDLFQAISDAGLPDRAPFDPQNWHDNGQLLPSSNLTGDGKALYGLSQHNGSHPSINDWANETLGGIEDQLRAGIIDVNEADRRIRDVADTISSASVGGFLNSSDVNQRLVYNAADPIAQSIIQAANIDPSLTGSARREAISNAINAHNSRILDGLIDRNGVAFATHAEDLAQLRDLTGWRVGNFLSAQVLEIRDLALAHMLAHGIDPKKVSILEYAKRHASEILERGSQLFDVLDDLSKSTNYKYAAFGTGRLASIVGGAAGGAFAALDIYDNAESAGRLLALANGEARFSTQEDTSEIFGPGSGTNYLFNTLVGREAHGLGSITVNQDFSHLRGETAIRQAVDEYLQNRIPFVDPNLRIRLRDISYNPDDSINLNASPYIVEDVRYPGVHVEVYFNAPLGAAGAPTGGLALRRVNDDIILQDFESNTTRLYRDPSRRLEQQVKDALNGDPEALEAINNGSYRSIELNTGADNSFSPTELELAGQTLDRYGTSDDLTPAELARIEEVRDDLVEQGGPSVLVITQDNRTSIFRGAINEIERFLASLARGPGLLSADIRNFSISDFDFSDVGSLLGSQLANSLPIENAWARIGASTAIGSFLTNVGQTFDGLGAAGDAAPNTLNEAFVEAFGDFGKDLLQAGTGAVSSYILGNFLKEVGLSGVSLDAAVAFGGPTIGRIAFNAFYGNAWNQGLTPGFYASAAASFLGSKLADQVFSFTSVSGQIGSAVGEAVGSLIASKLFAGSLATGNPYAIAAAAVVVAVSKLVGGLIGSLFGPSTSSATVAFDNDSNQFEITEATDKRGGRKEDAIALSASIAEVYNGVLETTGARLLGGFTDQAFGIRNQEFVYWNAPTPELRKRSKDPSVVIGNGVRIGLTQMVSNLGGGDVFAKRALSHYVASLGTEAFNLETLLGNFSVAQDYARYLSDVNSINSLIAAAPDSAFSAGWIATLASAEELGITKRNASDWIGGWNVFLDEMGDGAINGVIWSAARLEFHEDQTSFARRFEFLDENGLRTASLGDTIQQANKTRLEGTAGNDVIDLTRNVVEAFTVRGINSDGSRFDISADITVNVAAAVIAGEGDDIIRGGDLGSDLFGGDGNDTLFGGKLDDWIFGGAGNDRLDAGSDNSGQGGNGNYLDGGTGDDLLIGREGSDWLEGGEGVDVLRAGGNDDILSGGAGESDELYGGAGNDTYIYRRGDGADLVDDVDAQSATAHSPLEDEAANSAEVLDAILSRFRGIRHGKLDRDWLGTSAAVSAGQTAGGQDSISFGYGIALTDIRLSRSESGKDLLVEITEIGEDGSEVITGDRLTIIDWFSDPFKRVEWLKFVDGTEIRIGDITSFIVGGSGDDVLIGTNGNDFVYGGAGNDNLYTLAGNDIGLGGTGDDLVSGGADNDIVVGGLGDDRLIGGSGNDAVTGDAGNDSLYGSQGNDVLSGGRGNDLMVGGAGDDTFKFSRGDGHDAVFDDYSDHWTAIWKGGQWLNGYKYDARTGVVTAPDGEVIRTNVGTEAEPDLQWLGQFDFDDTTGELRRFTAPLDAATIVSDKGNDRIEFALDINLQDVMFERVAGTDDLRIVVGRENAETSLAAARDSITLTDWYDNPGSIERLAFYAAGEIDISETGYNLVAGTDAAEGAPLRGTDRKDWMTGAGGDDYLAGGSGDDIVAGNAGSDHLKGEAGNDVLYGGSGNDILDGGIGRDILSGGAGFDTASYASAADAVTVYLSNAELNQGDAFGDTYDSIENLIGSGAGDVLGGDDGDNELTGGKGSDMLLGGLGDDTYIWNIGDGADVIEDVEFVAETIVSAEGEIGSNYKVFWTQLGDPRGSNQKTEYSLRLVHIETGEVIFDDRTFTYDGANDQPDVRYWRKQGWQRGFMPATDGSVTRVAYDEQMDGGAADAIEMGAGISLADLYFEREGDDLRISYIANDDGNNGDGLAIGQSNTANLLVRNHFLEKNRVESLVFADGLSISLAAVLTAGSDGIASGSDAAELIVGQRGVRADVLDGGAGDDVLSGGEGDDRLLGGAGDDVLEGGHGADILDGGVHSPALGEGEEWTGIRGDTARYATSEAGVTIDLASSGPQSNGDAAGDTLIDIENVTGSMHDDTLSGNEDDNVLNALDGNNTVYGRGGDDVLIAGGGDDLLDGGTGEDALEGGAGNDVLRGGADMDILRGADGEDRLYGDDGDDTLLGGIGNDRLEGGAGNDKLYGEEGDDTLTGGAGSDLLDGGTGNDSLVGGEGVDTYSFTEGFGRDVITDSEGANEIVIDPSIAYDDLWFHRAGNDLVMTVRNADDRLTISNFFAAGDAASIYSIQAGGHRLFLGHPDVRNFLAAMQAESPNGVPASIPASITELMPRYWHEGTTARPYAEDFDLAIDEDMTTGAVEIGAIDHDENITLYEIRGEANFGTAAVDADGRFTYTPDLNYNGSDSFTVAIQDADGNGREIEVRVAVAAVDDAPVIDGIEGGGPLAIDERAPLSATDTGSTVGRVLASEFDGEEIYFELIDSADGRFIMSSDGRITVAEGAELDHEANASHTITVRVTDAVGSYDEKSFSVLINDINEAPGTPALVSATDFIIEGTAEAAVIATFALTDPEDTVPALIADGNPGNLFTIVGDEMRLANELDFETLAGYGYEIGDHDEDGRADIAVSVTVHADDGELRSDDADTLTFYVEDINEAPSALLTSGLAISFAERDRVPSNTALSAITLATLAVADADLAELPNAQYTFVVDDERFEIVGDQLRLREGAAFDYESEETVSVTVTATDGGVDPISIARELTFEIENADDYLQGTQEADILVGQANRDVITGLTGDDRIDGLSGDDTLIGNDGADTIYGGTGADEIFGNADDDMLQGGDGADAIFGGTGHDVISGGNDGDTIMAGDGDDVIIGDDDDARDTIDGGDGTDRLDYTALERGVVADLSAGVADGDAVQNVEEIAGTAFADTLTGDDAANRLIGGAGNDVLSGLAGSDRLEGGAGNDTLAGGEGDDLLYGEDGDDSLSGDGGADNLYGGAGADNLSGGAGNDRLEGGAGNDILDAGDGDDTYIVDRRSDHDTIFNYDQFGTDIDVLGFSDTFGEITEHDLWFERENDDLVVFIIGEDTSVRVTNWYTQVDADGRANHRLDFLLGGGWVSRETDVEGLAEFQSNFDRPGSVAELEALRSDPVYDATVATFYSINALPEIVGIADQRILEDGRMELTLVVSDDYTPSAGIEIRGTVTDGADLLGPQGLEVGAVGEDGKVTIVLAPAAHVAGEIGLSFTAIDAGSVEATADLVLTIDPVADTPLITRFVGTPGTSGADIALTLAVEFPDQDGSEEQQVRIAGIPGGLRLNRGARDAQNGEWVLAPSDLTGLALLAPAGWFEDLTLSVTAYASEGGTAAQSMTATTTLIINAPPTNIISGLSIEENSVGGTEIGYLQGVDPDNDTLAYELLDDADGRLALEADGLLKVANGLKLDYEAGRSHTIRVRVTDTFGESFERSVTVGINDVNERPNISGDTSPVLFEETVSPATALASFAGSDPEGGATTFRLVSNQDLFVIRGNEVFLREDAPRDFLAAEAYANARGISAGDFDGDGRRDIMLATVEVVANDGTSDSSIMRRNIYVEDVPQNPNAPVVTAQPLYSETGDGLTPHAGRVVATFALSDPDNTIPALVITGGNENGWFNVTGNSIVFAPNVDLSADYLRSIIGQQGVAGGFTDDLDKDNLAELVVANLSVAARDNDGRWSNATNLVVRIEDRNEGPRFDLTNYGFGLAETASAYTSVGTVSARDVDGPADALTYGFVGGSTRFDSHLSAHVGVSADNRLLVNSKTGQIYTASGSAFAGTGGQDFGYSLNVIDRNGDTHALSASAALRIGVDAVNEPHTLRDASGKRDEVEGLEPFVPIFNLREQMLDDPEGRNMRWQFADGTNEQGIWLLTPDGNLTLRNGGVDYEALISYTVYVEDNSNPFEPEWRPVTRKDPSRATKALRIQAIDDSLGLVTEATFTATINDVNEGAYLTSAKQFYVQDDRDEDKKIGTLFAKDPDTGSTSVSFVLDRNSVTYVESRLSKGTSDDVDNSGNPYITIENNNELHFEMPNDGEWEGGIKNHPTLGGRWYYQLDVSFDIVMTDPTGLESRENVNITFAKHGERAAPPIVFDLDGDGIELISLYASEVAFDMDGDGVADQTGWVSTDDGLLALDRNGNGMIDDISEISFLGDVLGAESDLEGLAAFDTNGDGRLDAEDERFSEFRIWRDLNQDGVSQAAELLTLPQSGITALDLTSEEGEGGTRGLDNFILGTVAYERSNGTTGTAGDVFLAYETSVEDVDDNEDTELAAPVLLDMDGDGEALVMLGNSSTSFDQDGDGERERTAWFAAGDAVLAVDRNENGMIDDISEISFLGDVEGAQTDLEGLAAYDHDGNGRVDSNDIDFAKLKLWFDRDSDGVTDAGELISLSEAGVSAISLDATSDETTGRQSDGSVIYGKATFLFDDGREGVLFDTALAYLANGTTHSTRTTGDSEAEAVFDTTERTFEDKAKDHRVYSSAGELAVHLRKPKGDLDARTQTMGAVSEMQFSDKTYGYLDAIVLDLDRDGLETKRHSKAKAQFDMNGDGIADDTGWTTSKDGFLVIDRNDNGVIDDGSELSFYLDAPEARSAMQGLATFDTNRDGLVSVLDERFGELKIWVDANHDGRSDAGEMRSLAEAGIASISLRAQASGKIEKLGRNVLLSTAVFNMVDGSMGTIGDVAFGYKSSSLAANSGEVGSRADHQRDLTPQIEAATLRNFLERDGINGAEGYKQFSKPFDVLRYGTDVIGDALAAFDEMANVDQKVVIDVIDKCGLPKEGKSVFVKDGGKCIMPGLEKKAESGASNAQLLALLRQDMAAFGHGGALEDQLRSRHQAFTLHDFYS